MLGPHTDDKKISAEEWTESQWHGQAVSVMYKHQPSGVLTDCVSFMFNTCNPSATYMHLNTFNYHNQVLLFFSFYRWGQWDSERLGSLSIFKQFVGGEARIQAGSKSHDIFWASLVAQTVKSAPEMQATHVWFLGGEDPLEKEMATHSSILLPVNTLDQKWGTWLGHWFQKILFWNALLEQSPEEINTCWNIFTSTNFGITGFELPIFLLLLLCTPVGRGLDKWQCHFSHSELQDAQR